MLQIEFSEEEIQQLNYERYHYPHPRIQRKMEVLYLKSRGLPHQEICRLCQISKTTLVSYLRQYQQGGIEQLKQWNYQGKPSQLNQEVKTIKDYFQKHPPRKITEAQAKIEELTGIKRSPTQIRAFLHRIGMRCRKVGFVPGKGSDPEKIEEQEVFRQQKLEPVLKQAQAGKKAVFFVDAAHFVHRAYLGFIWCFTRVFMGSPSGRQRLNVLGAVNAVTKDVVSITNETYVNAETVCELLVQLSELDLAVPIVLVLDNASYQKCRFVRDIAGFLGIELLYLPSYSPHLNLIERLWRFVRCQCLYSQHYQDFTDFKDAILRCLDQAGTEHQESLHRLLSWNFQSFEKVQFSTV